MKRPWLPFTALGVLFNVAATVRNSIGLAIVAGASYGTAAIMAAYDRVLARDIADRRARQRTFIHRQNGTLVRLESSSNVVLTGKDWVEVDE
jgi:hypothetical protein